MQMFHSLPAIRAGIDHQSESAPAWVQTQALLLGDRAGSGQEPAQQCLLTGGAVGQRAEVLLGDHQDVRRRLRMDVREGQHIVGLIETRHRDGATRDLAEEAIKLSSHGCMLNPETGPWSNVCITPSNYFLKYLGIMPGAQGS